MNREREKATLIAFNKNNLKGGRGGDGTTLKGGNRVKLSLTKKEEVSERASERASELAMKCATLQQK